MVRHPAKPALLRQGITVLLILVGVLLAKYTYPLLYGAELAFMGLPAWFALRRLSLKASMIVAVISAAAGIFLLGASPLYALVPLEVLVVGLLVRKRIRSMIFADFVYWLVLGIWLSGVGYHLLTDGESPYRAIFLLIAVINGLLNAGTGEMIADYLPVRLPGEAKTVRLVRLGDATFHFTVCLLGLPLVIFLALSGLFHQYDDLLAERAALLADGVNEYFGRLDDGDAHTMDDGGSVQKERLDDLFRALSPQGQTAYILTDGDDRVIAANRSLSVGEPYNWRSGGTVKQLGEDFYLWLPNEVPEYNGISRWTKGDYVAVSLLERQPYRLIIRQPAAEVQNTVFDLYFTALLSTFFIVLAGVPAVTRMTRRITGEIAQISRFASVLPENLASNVKPEWEAGRITELHSLKHSILETATVLKRMHRERQARETELRRIAHKDPLTGLDNRYSFHQYLDNRLAVARATGEKVACLFLDFDHLKKINDTLGHAAGDAVLAALGDHLRELETGKDNLRCFRLAGDEFIVVAGEPLPDGLESWANGVCEMLSRRTVNFNGQCIPLKASAGLAVFPMDGENEDALLRHSDRAMYESKRANRTEA